MTQIPDTDATRAALGKRVDKDPPAPSTLPEERKNPGQNTEGTGGAGARRPSQAARTVKPDL